MDKRIILWIVIAILAVLTIYVVFFRGSGGTGSAVSAGKSAGQVVSSGMVGGC